MDEKFLEIDDKLKYLDMIYLGCMNEIIAKISIEQAEKGFLLEKIWNSHVEIIQKALKMNKKISTDENKAL